MFPKGKNKVNIGLGIQQKALDGLNKQMDLRRDLKTLIDEYVKSNTVIANPKISDGEIDQGNSWGTWQVSVRRQNDCMVANGYMLVGDSAWMPKPLDAGGIGPAIIAATIAGRVAVEAVQSKDTSENALWKYNMEFINDYGYKTAGLEVFRRMLQGLTNEQINYGMKHFLSKMDVDKISRGEHPEFGTVDKLGFFIRGALNRRLAENLKYTSQLNQKLVQHYYDYPTIPQSFPQWQAKLNKYLVDAFSRFT